MGQRPNEVTSGYVHTRPKPQDAGFKEWCEKSRQECYDLYREAIRRIKELESAISAGQDEHGPS